MVRQRLRGVNAEANGKSFRIFTCGANSTQAFFIEGGSGGEGAAADGERMTMKLLRNWDTVETKLEEFALPPALEKIARWVESHPRAVLAGALVVLMAVVLAQSPADSTSEADPYSGETPLFV